MLPQPQPRRAAEVERREYRRVRERGGERENGIKNLRLLLDAWQVLIGASGIDVDLGLDARHVA